jgi:hypothetical protein
MLYYSSLNGKMGFPDEVEKENHKEKRKRC